jgi:predicted hotdog family 3-hydroxylacyl-ACP dehydratase
MSQMQLDRAAIAARIPHAGAMCLLHEVLAWDAQQITARAINHRDAGHPLRNAQGLPVTAGIEYAAQAMAVHGSLLGDGRPRAGRLASVRGVQTRLRWLDQIEDDLTVQAQRISADDAGMVYDFQLHAGAQLLLQGRASIALLAPNP